MSATAGSLGDSYCSLAWGSRLASQVGPATAAAVLVGDDTGLEPREQALAVTAYVALRLAFASVNAALGSRPDRELADAAPAELLERITWGRPVDR